MRFSCVILLALSCLFVLSLDSRGADWPRFLGPGGRGISHEQDVPLTWSDSQNLQWKTALPGPGSSSPIVAGGRVFVTCYSGYGEDANQPGSVSQLARHLLCVDRTSGKILWQRAVASAAPEDPYQGYITEHGYASSTPVVDEQHVYAFFGKTGVVAFDVDGNRLWQVDVGTESSNRRWGSAASLVLYNDLLIVNSSEESQSVRALDRKTGEEVWKAEAAGLELAYGTPSLVDSGNGQRELVLSVPGEVWGLEPDTGKLRRFAETVLTGNICPSVVHGDGQLYVFGGYRSFGSLALRPGGKGDVTDSHVTWTSRVSSYVATPLLHEGHLYWVDDRGLAYCVEASTGKEVYRERLAGMVSGGRPVYASPVFAAGRLYVVSRRSGTYVVDAQPEFRQLAQNRFAGDDSIFNGTPAISNGQMFLRSDRYLYCVAQ